MEKVKGHIEDMTRRSAQILQSDEQELEIKLSEFGRDESSLESDCYWASCITIRRIRLRYAAGILMKQVAV